MNQMKKEKQGSGVEESVRENDAHPKALKKERQSSDQHCWSEDC